MVPALLDKGSNYYNPEYAIRILQSKEFRSSIGNYQLGCIFSNGEHVSKNYKVARKYFERAAQDDLGEAWYKLAYLYYYGTAGSVDLKMAKECFEKAIFCGFNCEYAYEMVCADLGEKIRVNPMKEYADLIISETTIGKDRNKRIQEDLANDFGDYWTLLHEKTRDYIYSGIKTYINNYEDEDPFFDFSGAINPMGKSLEHELGEVFYTKYKQWLHSNGVENIKEYFESIGYYIDSENDPFELGAFKRVAYKTKTVETDYFSTINEIKDKKIPAVVRRERPVRILQLHEKFYEYVNGIVKENVFSIEEREQEVAAFIINLSREVEIIRTDYRNRANHDTKMNVGQAEVCGNTLYKTKKLLYNLISKIEI